MSIAFRRFRLVIFSYRCRRFRLVIFFHRFFSVDVWQAMSGFRQCMHFRHCVHYESMNWGINVITSTNFRSVASVPRGGARAHACCYTRAAVQSTESVLLPLISLLPQQCSSRLINREIKYSQLLMKCSHAGPFTGRKGFLIATQHYMRVWLTYSALFSDSRGIPLAGDAIGNTNTPLKAKR